MSKITEKQNQTIDSYRTSDLDFGEEYAGYLSACYFEGKRPLGYGAFAHNLREEDEILHSTFRLELHIELS